MWLNRVQCSQKVRQNHPPRPPHVRVVVAAVCVRRRAAAPSPLTSLTHSHCVCMRALQPMPPHRHTTRGNDSNVPQYHQDRRYIHRIIAPFGAQQAQEVVRFSLICAACGDCACVCARRFWASVSRVRDDVARRLPLRAFECSHWHSSHHYRNRWFSLFAFVRLLFASLLARCVIVIN